MKGQIQWDVNELLRSINCYFGTEQSGIFVSFVAKCKTKWMIVMFTGDLVFSHRLNLLLNYFMLFKFTGCVQSIFSDLTECVLRFQ